MAIVKEKYSGQKINLLYQLLQGDQEDGRPREYDISVDDLKVVRRTTDPEKFFLHEDFIREDTRYLCITLYEGTSKRNTRYVYYLKEGVEEERGTLAGIEQTVNEKMLRERQQWNYELLQKENEELKEELGEQEGYIEKLESELEAEKGKKASVKDSWGEVFSIALEGMVRRNSHLLGNIPMIGQGLAGAVEMDNKRMESGTQNNINTDDKESAVFRRKVSKGEDAAGVVSDAEEVAQRKAAFEKMSEGDSQIIAYHKKLQATFSTKELSTIIKIIAVLSEQRENIELVYQTLLSEEGEENNSSSQINADLNETSSY